jgi:hypothetical protein
VGERSSYFAASITAVLLIVRPSYRKEECRETNAIIVLPEPTKKHLHISITLRVYIYIESRLTLSRAPQTGNSLLDEPRFEIWLIKEPLHGASESFLRKSSVDSLIIIT